MSDVKKATVAPPPVESAKARYLLANGWEPDGDPDDPFCRWFDPTFVPGKDRKVVAHRYTDPDQHREVVIEQVVCAPVRYPVPAGEAVQVQAGRDKVKRA